MKIKVGIINSNGFGINNVRNYLPNNLLARIIIIFLGFWKVFYLFACICITNVLHLKRIKTDIMKTIYLEKDGISMQVLNVDKFEVFNWLKFKKGENVYIDGKHFADFVSYEKSELYNDEIIKLKINE